MESFRNFRDAFLVTKRLLLPVETHLNSTVGRLSPMLKPLQRIRFLPVFFAHPGRGSAKSFYWTLGVVSFFVQAGSSLIVLKKN